MMEDIDLFIYVKNNRELMQEAEKFILDRLVESPDEGEALGVTMSFFEYENSQMPNGQFEAKKIAMVQAFFDLEKAGYVTSRLTLRNQMIFKITDLV